MGQNHQWRPVQRVSLANLAPGLWAATVKLELRTPSRPKLKQPE